MADFMDDGEKPVQQVFPGDRVGLLRCPVCGVYTEHVYGFFEGEYLTCLRCHPEAEDEVKGKNESHL